MGVIIFTCPKCGTKRRTATNTGFACMGCKTRYSIGGNGEIRSARTPKN